MRRNRRGRPGRSGCKAGRPGESCSWPSRGKGSAPPKCCPRCQLSCQLSGVSVGKGSMDVQKVPERSMSCCRRIIGRHGRMPLLVEYELFSAQRSTEISLLLQQGLIGPVYCHFTAQKDLLCGVSATPPWQLACLLVRGKCGCVVELNLASRSSPEPTGLSGEHKTGESRAGKGAEKKHPANSSLGAI